MIVQPKYYSYDQLVADLPNLPGGRARALYARDYVGDDDHVIGMFRYDGSSVRLIGSLDLTELVEIKRATVTAVTDSTHVTVDDASWLSVEDTLRWIDISAGGEIADTEISSITGSDLVLASAATGIAIGDYGMRPADMVPFTIGGASRNIEILPGATIDTDGHLQTAGGDVILWVPQSGGYSCCWGGQRAAVTLARTSAVSGQIAGFGPVLASDATESFVIASSYDGTERVRAYYGDARAQSAGNSEVGTAAQWGETEMLCYAYYYGGGNPIGQGHHTSQKRRGYVFDSATVTGTPCGFLIRATPGGAETVTATVTEIST